MNEYIKDVSFNYALALVDKTDSELIRAYKQIIKNVSMLKLKHSKLDVFIVFDCVYNELCFREVFK